MALNENLIYKYNFSSDSNVNWNFELQFLRGKNVNNEPTGYSSDLIPDSFILKENLIIKSSYADNLPLGMPLADTLELNLNIDNLTGDWLDLAEWCVIGGQTISNVYYPNQWRLLSNNGRGASDVNYNIVEFWGVQDEIPEIEREHEFGKDTIFKINLVDVKTYLTNKVTDYSRSNSLNETTATIFQHYFAGNNSLSQAVAVSTLTYFTFEKYQAIDFETLTTFFITGLISEAQRVYLRNWIRKDTSSSNQGVIAVDGRFLDGWTFYKQLYDLTTQKGASLSISNIKVITQIIDKDDNEIGGLCNSNSKDGFFQYKTLTDILIALAEQFVKKCNWRINRDNTLDSERLILRIEYPYESATGGSISLNSNNVYGMYKVSKGKRNNASSTVNIKSYDNNLNRIVVSKYGNNKQDTYDNKSLFTSNIQIGKKEQVETNQTHVIRQTLINQLLYSDTNTVNLYFSDRATGNISNNLFVIHSECNVLLGQSKNITNENISSDTINPANLENKNKYVNRDRLIIWNALRNSKAGLNYVQAKAYNSICSSKSIHIEFNSLDYIVRARDLGEQVICNIWQFTKYSENFFYNNQFWITDIEFDVIKGTSKFTMYGRGE
jgi:hypothetical protein